MKPISLTHQRIRAITFIIGLWIVGISLAFWFGLGWFFLFRTVHRILFVTPYLYLQMMEKVVGDKASAEEERKRISQAGGNLWFRSTWSIVGTIVSVLLTFFAFWKINMPIIDIIRLIFE